VNKAAITVGQRLAQLKATVHPPSRGPYTHSEIAEGVYNASGVRVSEAYLSQLMANTRDNPSGKLVAGLAAFFGVTVDSFYDGEVAALQDEQVKLLRAFDNKRLKAMALRAIELSPTALASVAAVIDELAELEGRLSPHSRRRRVPPHGTGD